LTQEQSFGGIVALQPHSEAESPQRTLLEQMIIEALQQGQSETYILELVKQATAPTVQEETVTRNSVAHTNAFLSLIEGQEDPLHRAPNGMQTYFVQHGDSLASIAALFYNDTRSAFDIFNANRGTIGSPDNLFVGQELVIPAL
jgi:nucleoid-associated protein YgaU